MKKIDLKVTLEFSDEIYEKYSEDIMNNVEDAIRDKMNNSGIVPDECDAYTKDVIVTEIEPFKEFYLVVNTETVFVNNIFSRRKVKHFLFADKSVAEKFVKIENEKVHEHNLRISVIREYEIITLKENHEVLTFEEEKARLLKWYDFEEILDILGYNDYSGFDENDPLYELEETDYDAFVNKIFEHAVVNGNFEDVLKYNRRFPV